MEVSICLLSIDFNPDLNISEIYAPDKIDKIIGAKKYLFSILNAVPRT